ncbi:MAG: hypothetical protein LRZ84_14340 [Desertifilum sp.]|nr:hypothetical protein [Desertifilum sp.]
MTQAVQLELFQLRAPKAPEKPENPYLIKMLQALRAEAAELLAIANKLFSGNWQNLQEVPTEELKQVRSHYNQVKGLPPPAWELPQIEEAPKIDPTIKPYRPWTEERRIANRLRLLHQRMVKKWSLVELRQEALYDAVSRQPQYYGVCPLPGSQDACTIKLPNPEREAAIQFEIMDREIRSGRMKPLNLPLKLTQKEPELVEIRQI